MKSFEIADVHMHVINKIDKLIESKVKEILYEKDADASEDSDDDKKDSDEDDEEVDEMCSGSIASKDNPIGKTRRRKEE